MHLYLNGTPTVVSLFLYLLWCILISKLHSFVKQDKKAWLPYVDGKSLSVCMPWGHRWKEADFAHFQVLSYHILKERVRKTMNMKGQPVSELKFQCGTSWKQSRVLPPLLQCFVDTCKFLVLLRWRYSPEWALASFTIRLQASRSLALSLHSFIPIFFRSVDTWTCKFTSWNYKESFISSLLYQMFLLSITEDNWQYTVQQ